MRELVNTVPPCAQPLPYVADIDPRIAYCDPPLSCTFDTWNGCIHLAHVHPAFSRRRLRNDDKKDEHYLPEWKLVEIREKCDYHEGMTEMRDRRVPVRKHS
jgi:hypothetical protein